MSVESLKELIIHMIEDINAYDRLVKIYTFTRNVQ